MGFPEIENQLFVLDCKLPIDGVKRVQSELYDYLEEGVQSGAYLKGVCAKIARFGIHKKISLKAVSNAHTSDVLTRKVKSLSALC